MALTVSTDATAQMRVDKWLWAARFFKTRSLASAAIDKHRITIGGNPVKASRDVRLGDIIGIEQEGVLREVVVVGICESRGPASLATTMYRETDESQARRRVEAERRRLFREPAATLAGRPTKRERRVIDDVIDKLGNEA